MDVQHHIEYLTEDGCFSVDIALPDDKIALEIDGPHHFTRNSYLPLGDTIVRDEMLRARGWYVISIPFFSWSGLEESEKRALLDHLLKKAQSERLN